jgi:transcription elongation factor Elf1
MGTGITKQCPRCKKLKTRSVKPNEDNSKIVTLHCSGCNLSRPYLMPSGWQWVHHLQAPSKGDERGAWIFNTDVVSTPDEPSSESATEDEYSAKSAMEDEFNAESAMDTD